MVSNGASLTICDRQGNQAKDIISRSSAIQQQRYLYQILNQPQVNLSKSEYREYVPEGDRQLAPIIKRENLKERDFDYLSRRWEN